LATKRNELKNSFFRKNLLGAVKKVCFRKTKQDGGGRRGESEVVVDTSLPSLPPTQNYENDPYMACPFFWT